MLSRMKWLISGALLAALMTASIASAEAASPLSSADLKKLLTYLDSIGVKQNFAAPMANNLGLSQDEKQELPVVSVVTSDHKIYFCRSSLNAKDYIIWVIGAHEKSSSIFVTHDDLKLTRALYMQAEKIPQLQNLHDDEVEAAYEKALAALAQDLKKTNSQ
jgi:pseudouridine-5'-phosphate glycosidase